METRKRKNDGRKRKKKVSARHQKEKKSLLQIAREMGQQLIIADPIVLD